MANEDPFENLLPPGFLPVDARIWRARRQVEFTESLVKQMFDFAKWEADQEKEHAREQMEKAIQEAYDALEQLRELGPHTQGDLDRLESNIEADAMDREDELKEELAEIEETVNEVGRLCVVLMDRALREVLGSFVRKAAEPRRTDSLEELKQEFKQQFDIDFESSPVPWERVVELREARNCILHTDSVVDDRFRKKVRNPVLLQGNKIVVGRENFQHCVRVFSEFTQFVIKSVEEAKARGNS